MSAGGWMTSPGTASHPAGRVSVLVVDPELAAAVPERHRAAAESALQAGAVEVPAGAWPATTPRDPGTFGLLVLEGLICARVSQRQRAHAELLGAGDVLQPWVGLPSWSAIPGSVDWRVLEPARLAVLDRSWVTRAVAVDPAILAALAHRFVVRTRRMSLQMAINAEPGVARRVELMLWHFADRWGHVTADGVRLHLPLTHGQLGEVVAAQRPSVTTALSALRDRGRLATPGAGQWVLRGDPPPDLVALQEQVGLRRPEAAAV